MDILRTRSADLDFHRSRRMFCIKDGKTKIAPEGTITFCNPSLSLEPFEVGHGGYFFLQGTRCSSTKGRGSSLTMLS